MPNPEQLEAALTQFNGIWNESIAPVLARNFDMNAEQAAAVYRACWQSFLHGLGWVVLKQTNKQSV